MKKHPTDLHLEGLYLDQERERRRMLLHVIDCPRCREQLEGILRRKREAQGAAPDGSDESGRDETEPAPGDLALKFALILKKQRIDAPELFLN